MNWCYDKSGNAVAVSAPQTAAEITTGRQGTFNDSTQTGQLGRGIGVGGVMNNNSYFLPSSFSDDLKDFENDFEIHDDTLESICNNFSNIRDEMHDLKITNDLANKLVKEAISAGIIDYNPLP